MNPNIPQSPYPRIVIIGGGFGGLKLIEKLKRDNFQIVLLDRNNYHQFQPLLYQVATAGLNPGSIAFPFRKDFRKIPDFHFRLTEVKRIIPNEKRVETTIGSIAYDYLVIAAGTDTNYFGMQNLKAHAMPMKSVVEAMALRTKLLSNLEKALTTEDPFKQQRLLNVVIVGGGATGVEIAGALTEMKRYILQKDYPDLGNGVFNIFLMEGASRLLGGMSEQASQKAYNFLQKMGVDIRLNTKVTGYENGCILFGENDNIPTETVIWVSGVTANRLEGIPETSLGRGGRIVCNEFNQVKGLDTVFAIGDICLQTEDNYPQGHPQVAQVAIQQGKLLASNIIRSVQQKTLLPFHYRDKGSLATVGRNRAVADLPYLKTQGFIAWFLWMTVHLRSILGVRNRLEILLNWMWNYFTYDQAIRLIFTSKRPEEEDKEQPS